MLQIDILLLVSLSASFIILLIKKIGLADRIVEQSKNRIISELFSCDFCLSFWTSVIVSIAYAFLLKDITYIIYAVFATPIARFLL